MLVQGRWPPEFKRTHVSKSETTLHRQLKFSCRSIATGYVREGANLNLVPRRFRNGFRARIRAVVEIGSRAFFNHPSHCYRRRSHEPLRDKIHGVSYRFLSRLRSKLTSSTRLSLKHVAQGGTVAEEVISTVRTAQAFGTQAVLSAIYDSHVVQAFDAEIKTAIVVGIGLSVFFFAAYSAYALAFAFGTTLIIQGHG